jgi:hypothetical protein
MRIITSNDLNQFSISLSQLSEESGQLANLAVDSSTVALMGAAAGHSEAGLAIGLTAASKLLEEQGKMYVDFEIHAEKCLGECRKNGEDGKAFFERIAALSENQLIATMQRNNIHLAG